MLAHESLTQVCRSNVPRDRNQFQTVPHTVFSSTQTAPVPGMHYLRDAGRARFLTSASCGECSRMWFCAVCVLCSAKPLPQS